MTNIALLINNTIIYWNQILVILAILISYIFPFAPRTLTGVRKKAIRLWFPLCWIFGFFFSRLLYFYCRPWELSSIQSMFCNIFDNRHTILGLAFGSIAAALVLKMCHLEKKTNRLLDTTFPGIILAISIIRLSYLFTGMYHSKIPVKTEFFQIFPFAIKSLDISEDISYTFAPFLISSVILLFNAFATHRLIKRSLRRPGDRFCLNFLFLIFSEMVLESTRYDSLKVHLNFFRFANRYVGFISFSMFLCGLCAIAIFLFKYHKLKLYKKFIRCELFPIVFFSAFICFGVSEFLVQRYTSSSVIFHWIQGISAIIMFFTNTKMIIFTNVLLKP